MEKLMLLVPKIWQEENLLLEISFFLGEGRRWQEYGLFLVEKGCFQKKTGGEVVEKRQKEVPKTKKRQGKFGG